MKTKGKPSTYRRGVAVAHKMRRDLAMLRNSVWFVSGGTSIEMPCEPGRIILIENREDGVAVTRCLP